MKMIFNHSQKRVGRVTPCAPLFAIGIDGAHGVTRSTSKAQRAFTMIEIAIALAVIAFALVAIIGVLPTGMNVQKDNREETIINQDGPFFLEAIRTGARGLDHLTNYVDTITVRRVGETLDVTTIFTNDPTMSVPGPAPYDGTMTNGQRIIGLLSIPKYEGPPTNRFTNTISARVRALTGSATEQGTANPDFAFSYLLVPEITPYMTSQITTNSTNYLYVNDPSLPGPSPTPAEVQETANRKAKWVEVRSREENSSEIRLTFRWPLFQNTNGPNRQSFRALVSGSRTNIDIFSFFVPQAFAAAQFPPPSP